MDMDKLQEKPGYCTLCRSRCGTLNTVRGDALVAVRPDPDHPTGQAMCMKGKAAPELVHSPHRLRYPMRRTRPKTEADPGWVRISWEEALRETAERLGAVKRESGAEAVVFGVTTPSGTPLSDSIEWIERFVRLFGSPNICYATEICNWHKDHAHEFTFGCGIPVADYAKADLVLLWGHNPSNTWLAQSHAIARGRAAGARLMVVDPRPTALATQADSWLRVRPGTDAALALGLVHLLIESGRFDHAFVRDWTNGPLLVRSDNGRFLRLRDLQPGAAEDSYMVWDSELGAAVPYDVRRAAGEQGAGRFALRGEYGVALAGGLSPAAGGLAPGACGLAPSAGGAAFGVGGLAPSAGGAASVPGRAAPEAATSAPQGAPAPLVCHPAFELLARESAAYPAERVAEITGVGAEALRAAAELLASSRRVAYHSWTGIGQHTNATQSDRAVATLYALLGCFDTDGSNRQFGKPAHRSVNPMNLLAPEQRAKALGLAERPVGPPSQGWVTALDTYRAILEAKPYKVRAMLVFGSNLPVSQADTDLAAQALQALEFHVHCDLFETPAARFADLLLPINTPWEREGLRIGFEIDARAASHVQLRQRMVPPQGESRSDNDIVFDLAQRLGMGEAFFGGSLQAGWDHMLEPLGLSVAQLRERPEGVSAPFEQAERKYSRVKEGVVEGFATETRRVEIYSERLLRHGQPPLAAFLEPAESPRDPARTQQGRYPYILGSAKNGYYCHSQHRGLASLRRRATYPVAEIGAGLAAAKGIAENDWVRVSTRVGQARFVARIVPGLADDLVVAEYGWWQACPELGQPGYGAAAALGSNFNRLISAEDCDPVSGSVAQRSFLCDIERDPATEARQRGWAGWRPLRVAALERLADGVLGIELASTPSVPSAASATDKPGPKDQAGQASARSAPSPGGSASHASSESPAGRGAEEELPDYLPGQHLTVRVQTGGAGGECTRAYSLTGAASVPNRRSYRIAVREQEAGAVSGYLHRRLRVGDLVEVGRPAGSFVLPQQSPQPLVLLAAGIGITPFMGLLESLAGQEESPEIWLLHGSRNSASHAFRQRIAELAGALACLRVVRYYTAPAAQDRRGVDYEHQGRLTAEAVAAADPTLIARRARFYLCGPEDMMKGLRTGLIARGVPSFDLFGEAFRSPARLPAGGLARASVTFARSGRPALEWTAEQGTLLQFGEALGLNLASGCRVGQCESCAVGVVSGRVLHLSGSEPEDPAQCLACQAVPLGDLVLDA